MKSKKYLAAFIFTLIFTASLTPVSFVSANQASLYSMDIALEGSLPYKAFALPPEIINHAGITALRVIDRESGEEIPYFIHSAAYEESAKQDYVRFDFVRQFERSRNYYLDFRAYVPYNIDPLVSHISLVPFQGEFLTNITVLGSYDGQGWTEVTSGLIYAVGDVSQTEIDLRGVQRYAYYRLRIPVPPASQGIDFQAQGIHRQAWIERIPFTVRQEADFEVDSADGISTVVLFGLAETQASMENLWITGVQIEAASIFKRNVNTGYGRLQTIYRLIFQDTELENTFITYPGYPQASNISFSIADHDDRPIDIIRIWVDYIAHYVIFRAEDGREYVLHYGGELNRPVYDIENFRDMIIQDGFDRVSLQGPALLINEGTIERDYSWLFNIVIVLAGIVLTIIAAAGFFKGRQHRPTASD